MANGWRVSRVKSGSILQKVVTLITNDPSSPPLIPSSPNHLSFVTASLQLGAIIHEAGPNLKRVTVRRSLTRSWTDKRLSKTISSAASSLESNHLTYRDIVMDPLSIASASAGLAITCVNITASICTWVNDTKNVDTTVTALCDEIVSLSNVLNAISTAWQSNPSIAATQISENGKLWSSIKAILGDCEATLKKLHTTLDGVNNRTIIVRLGFLRRPIKQFTLSMKRNDIATLKQRIQAYNGAVSVALQVINV